MPTTDMKTLTIGGKTYRVLDAVPEWAQQSEKPSYTAEEIEGLDTYINEKLGVIENGTY